MESILMSYSRLFKANLIVKANWLSVVSCGTRCISIKSCLMNEDGESDRDEKPANDKSKKNKNERSPNRERETEKPGKVYAKKESVPPAISSTLISQILSMNITSNEGKSGNVDFKLARPRNKREERAEIKRAKEEIQKEAPGLSIDLIQATKEVAKAVGGDVEKTKSELLTKLLADSADVNSMKLGDLISAMQVENDGKLKADSRKKHSEINESKQHYLRPATKNDLFGAKRLNIFTRKDIQPEKQILPTWEILNKRELDLSVTHPPKNAFEEEIQWLKQGKAWQFPIDNEQGLDTETQYGFNDHVFLEPLITDFPKTGPLRQFMELVLHGLSKNPYLSVPAKRESIEWFRQYFKDKAAVLQEQGVENVPLSIPS